MKRIIIAGLAGLILSSCGASPSVDPASSQANASSSGSGNSNGGNGFVSGPAPSSTPSPSPTSSTLPPIQTSFTVTGSGGSTPTFSFLVNTDNLLKVQVTSGSATNVIPGSNFSANYDCVTYQVSAAGQTITTQTLSVGGGSYVCPNAPSSQTLDFSSSLTPGHGPITITVSASGYDFYCTGCLTYPWLYAAYPYGPYSCSLYCPLHTVYKNHGVTGSLNVNVN